MTRDVKSYAPMYDWLKNPCLRHQSIISVNLKAEGEPEKGVACLQHIFPQYSTSTHIPSKGGKEGAYYTILKKTKLLLVSFRMISAKETSSGTK